MRSVTVPLSVLLLMTSGTLWPSGRRLASSCGPACAQAAQKEGGGRSGAAVEDAQIVAVQRDAARVLGASLAGEGAFALARSLNDEVGPRLAGTPGDARAVAWGLAALRAAGLSNVRAEPVRVPYWERGALEEGEVQGSGAQAGQRLSLTALGGSVGTGDPAAPGAPLSAEVLLVRSFEELTALGAERVRGKLVLFNVLMGRGADGMSNYGEVARYRSQGAVEAARLGAVGALVRSLGIASYRLPHTGAMRYQDGVPRVPAAALAAEDADLIERLLSLGRPVRLRLRLHCRSLGERDSANVIGEVPGKGPQAGEIVLIGGHLDSWDLGTGAVDDAAGVAIAITAAQAQRALPPARRTVRVVLFANEESGLRGAKAYAQAHQAELPRHVAALEADSGAGRPLGFAFPGAPAGRALLQRLVAPLASLGAERVEARDSGGADLIPLEGKVAILSMQQDTSRYFEWHHTAADTLDKIDRVELNLAAAAAAVLLRGLADSVEVLPRPTPPAAR